MADKEKIVQFPGLAKIESEAAAWIARLDSGNATAADESAFQEWVSQNPEHREAFGRLLVVWTEFASLRGQPTREQIGRLTPKQTPEVAPRANLFPSNFSWRPRTVGALCAAILIAAVVLVFANRRFGHVQAFETAVGAQRTITLRDGSRIVLNTNSRVEVALSASRRAVTLVRGEAYFEVAPEAARPFSVAARDSVVQAVGTAFNVKMLTSAVEVTVTNGKVEVNSGSLQRSDRKQDTAVVKARGLRSLASLSAGQDALLTSKVEQLSIVSDAEVDRKLAWRKGFIVFTDQNLSEVIEDIGRYTNIRFEIDDEKLKETKITGYFEVGRVDALLEALKINFNLKVDRVSGTVVRLSRAS